MTDFDKMAQRSRKSRAYKAYVRSLRDFSDIYAPKPAIIFDCLSQAHLNERNATSGELSREELHRQDPQAELPGELSNRAIRKYYFNAATCYGDAAIHCVLGSDLRRAFKYFRKAAKLCGRGTDCPADCSAEVAVSAQQFRENAAMVRHELARRSILRKRLSLGLLGRLR